MSVFGLSISASAWIAPLTALAALGMGTAIILLRDHLRLERHNLSLSADVERLQGELRRLTAAGERERTFAAVEQTPSPQNSETAIEPLAAVDVVSAQPIVVPPRKAPPAPKRVLLVEDDEVNALLAVKSLEKAGALIDWAKDGIEAVALVEEVFSGVRAGYDLVLMDLRMPRLNGLEATRQIRLMEASAGRSDPLRIAALTATAMRQDRIDAQAAGMSLFLSKPYAAGALVQLLEPTDEGFARAS